MPHRSVATVILLLALVLVPASDVRSAPDEPASVPVFGMHLTDDPLGARIGAIEAGSQAEELGLKPDETIVEIEGEGVTSTWDFLSRVDGLGATFAIRVRGEDGRARKETLTKADLPGKIVFRSNRSGTFELWRMDADGSDLRQLTTGDRDPNGPVWSRDGKRIAFEWRTPGGGRDIWIMNENGGTPQRVTRHRDDDTRPRWAPDGKHLYFITYEWEDTAIARVEIAAPEYECVARISPTPGVAPWRYPIYDISPDGERLAFPRRVAGVWELHLAAADGSDPHSLEQPGNQIAIDWAPDGKSVLWGEADGYFRYDVESRQATPFDIDRQCNPDIPECSVVFGPDADSLILSALADQGSDVWIAKGRGETLHQITYHPANDETPDWWVAP